MRTKDRRTAGDRGRLSVVRGGKPDEERVALDGVAARTAKMVAEARCTVRRQQLCLLADEVRALKRTVEGEVGVATTGLDAFARRLDQMAAALGGSGAC